MARGRDPRRAMDIHSDIVVGAEPAFAGVDPDPNTQLRPRRPRVVGKSTLDVSRCRDRAESAREDTEERVSLGTDDRAAVGVDRVPDDLRVPLEDRRVLIAERGE